MKKLLVILMMLFMASNAPAQRTQLASGPLDLSKPFTVDKPLYYVDTTVIGYWQRPNKQAEWNYINNFEYPDPIIIDSKEVEITPEKFGAKGGKALVNVSQNYLDSAYGKGKYNINDTWDYIGVNEMFRAAESNRFGAVMKFECREYYLSANPYGKRKGELPKINTANSNGTQKIYTIYWNGCSFKNAGLRSIANDPKDAADMQTFRTFICIGAAKFEQCDTGFAVVGFHSSELGSLSSYNCQMAGYLAFGLESKAEFLQAHQCSLRGWNIENWDKCGDGQCQMNQSHFPHIRMYASGTEEYGFRFYGSSGIDIGKATGEGAAGAQIFLIVDCSHKYSSFVKTFEVRYLHIESTYKNCAVYAIGGGGTHISFDRTFCQTVCTLIAAKDKTGETYIEVSNLYWNPGIKFRHEGAANTTLWWHFKSCRAINNGTFYDDINWEINPAKGWYKPNPYSPGQTTNNKGSNRLYYEPGFMF